MNPTFTSLSSTETCHPLTRASRMALKLLGTLPYGQLDIQFPDGSTQLFGRSAPADTTLRAGIRIKDWRVFDRSLQSGDIGFAESYMDDQWSSPDLAQLLRLFIVNREHLEKTIYGSWWGSLVYRVKHFLNRNSRKGSAKNIHAHYDLGNLFYNLWLDPSMSYSSAWFNGDFNIDLMQAQHAKARRALEQVHASENTRILEIGCGWGGLAELAISEYGAQVKGITLSNSQLDWTRERIAKLGSTRKNDFVYQDYRDLSAEHTDRPFDAIVSIEMIEAVGQEYWSSYFDTLHTCLKSGGRACIQTITIRDDLFDRYVHSTDFIQQYIFPGGLLPSKKEFVLHAHKAGLVVENSMAFGKDYAETLRRWRTDFLKNEKTVLQQKFDTRFIRTWEFYLAYCEAAFDEGNTDVVQFTLVKP